MRIIGISGKSGSGKDWLGRVLKKQGYLRFSLASHMKNEAVGGFFAPGPPLDDVTLYRPTYESVHFEKPPVIRRHLQQRGTEDGWMKYGKDYWLRIADAWIRTLQEDGYFDHATGIYVPDIRFVHEAEWIRSKGGHLLRLEGRGGLAGEAGRHLSETALDAWEDWDMQIDNSVESGLSAERISNLLWACGVIPNIAPQTADRWPQPDGMLCL